MYTVKTASTTGLGISQIFACCQACASLSNEWQIPQGRDDLARPLPPKRRVQDRVSERSSQLSRDHLIFMAIWPSLCLQEPGESGDAM